MSEFRSPNSELGGLDFRPTASLATLQIRADLLKRVRAFFDARGFLEVETPILSADVVVDRHLDSFSTILCDDPRAPEVGRRLWLQTSPEFGMKRLLAAGAEAIYQITRAFRNGEIGRLHNPEFTMVEWYRRGDDLRAGMQLLSDLADELLHTGPAETLAYGELFKQHVGLDPHSADTGAIVQAARQRLAAVPDLASDDRDSWLELLWGELVEPQLGGSRPAIVYDYPAGQAALAQLRGDPPVAERFELYAGGIELANGYHELLDPRVLRQRSAAANARRRNDGKPTLPEDSRLLAAMEHGLPACSGVALGFDRVVMIAAGAASVAEVIAFPIDRA